MRASQQFDDVTTGAVYIHSAPPALCPHVEWALSRALGARARLRWDAQPASDGQLRATADWTGPVGTAAHIADALRKWTRLRFEVTEEPSCGVDGERFCFVPGLGLWHGSTSANGDVVVTENRVRAMMAADPQQLAAELEFALGTAWDEALESYRSGGEVAADVSWLHRKTG